MVGRLAHDKLPASDRQHCLGVGARDGEERARRAAGLLAPLLPALQGANGNAHERGELRLREAGLLPRLDHGR